MRRDPIILGLIGVGVATGLVATPASAEEPHGCDKFAWSIEGDRALINATDRLTIASGAPFAGDMQKAVSLRLVPLGEAKLPKPPERAPKSETSFAGFMPLTAVPAGRYRVTMSDAAWVDAVQGDRYRKPVAFSGALECAGVRKSLRFDFDKGPLTLQVSGVDRPEISIVMHRDDE